MTEENNTGEKREPHERGSKKGHNIVLCGLPGCGKSSLGRRLAMSLRYGFVDLDEWIVRKKKETVGDIIQKSGVDYFRSLELKALNELAGLKNYVVALGGGTLTQIQSFTLAEQLGTLVWLDVPPKELAFRLIFSLRDSAATRPLLPLESGGVGVQQERTSEKMTELENKLSTLLSERAADFTKISKRFKVNYASEDVTLKNIISYLFEEKVIA